MKALRWGCVWALIAGSVVALSNSDRFTGVWMLMLALVLKP